MIQKILRTLTSKWDHMIIVIEEIINMAIIKIDYITSSLMCHEERLQGTIGESSEERDF